MARRRKASLSEKIFLIRSYYESRGECAEVQEQFENEYKVKTSDITKLIHTLIRQLETTGSVAGNVFFESGMICRPGEEEELSRATKKRRKKREPIDENPDPDLHYGFPDEKSEAAVKSEPLLTEENKDQEVANADLKDDSDSESFKTEREDEDELPVKPKRTRRRKKVVDYNETSDGFAVIQIQFTCDICGKCYETKKKLSRHKEQHKEVLTWHPCTICERPFKRKASRISHEASHYGKSERPSTICPVCGRSVMGSLKHHISKYHAARPTFVCEVCGKVLASTTGIKTHMRLHSGEKPYQCKLCLKTFTTNGGHEVHMRAHAGIKPYTCKFCDKKFIDGSTLRVHYRQHTGESPYVCQFCGKTCKQAQNLRSHIRHIHAKDSPIPTD